MDLPPGRIFSAIERISAAPFSPDQWPKALKSLADATGSSFGQICGWAGPGRLPINLTWNEPERMVDRWVELGGADPAINPIIRAGIRTPELATVADTDIISAGERIRLPIWGDFYDLYDLTHICFAPIWRDGSAHIMLVVCRSARKGRYDSAVRKTFGTIARYCREAIMTEEAIQTDAALILKGTFDVLSSSAFALDAFGRVVALSAGAERYLRSGDAVRIENGRLAASTSIGEQILARAVAPRLCLREPPVAPISVEVPGSGGRSMRLRIAQLPRDRVNIGFRPVVLAIIEKAPEPKLPPNLSPGLTAAERAVALALLEGDRPAQIASRRGVSVHTVRTQIKSIYVKAGVSGLVEFSAKARLRRLD